MILPHLLESAFSSGRLRTRVDHLTVMFVLRGLRHWSTGRGCKGFVDLSSRLPPCAPGEHHLSMQAASPSSYLLGQGIWAACARASAARLPPSFLPFPPPAASTPRWRTPRRLRHFRLCRPRTGRTSSGRSLGSCRFFGLCWHLKGS